MSPRSPRRSPGGGSSPRRRKKRSDDEADSSEEDMIAVAKWTVPEPKHLRNLVRARHFHVKDFNYGKAVGTGTFAVVRVVEIKGAEDEETPPMALKTMFKAQLVKTNQVDHIKGEKRLMSMLDSPFIVAFLSSFQDERRIFLLLEFVHGGEIFGRLRRDGRLPVVDAKFYAVEMVLALAYLQSFAVAYRDIKPENVLIDWKGHIKLTDFGFAKVVNRGELTYTLVGTPEYLAPEIIKSVGHNASVDFWALGILIYEMLAGYPPFYDPSPFEVYKKIIDGKIKYPRHFDVKAVDLIEHLLNANTMERFSHLDCMTHVWFDFVDWREMMAMAVKPPWRPRLESIQDTEQFEDVPDELALDDYDVCEPITLKANKVFVGAF